MTASVHEDHSTPPRLAAPRTAVLVCSPRAQRNAAVRAALATAGVVVAEVICVDDLDPTARLGGVWRARGIEVAIAAGGDGTIGSVVTQLAGDDLPLGILPLGTSNDTARSLGLPLDLARACEVIASGAPVAVDAGRVLASAVGREGGADGGRYFLHALTLGVNVEFARLATDLVRRRRWGRLNYAASALEAVTRFEPLDARVTLEGVTRCSQYAAQPDALGTLALEQSVVQIAAVNLPIFGGGLSLALRGTELHDRLLDVVVIEAPSLERLREVAQGWLEGRRALGGRGRPRNVVERDGAVSADLPVDIAGLAIPGVTRYQARAMTVHAPSGVDVTLDGEIRARTPLRVEAAQGAVRVMLPETRPTSNVRAGMVR